ncbi:MAG TPA: YihY/virulence factor BrkB family protein [Candidatus Tenderia electrophaga]|uniref:YihY/virulence factor BrkB family protein n=1 Tax=Candidatus Tenderia electrophaga TaxID=1748243 RepID=A0A832N4Y5_9GAMM|nr:YihY/virulence factor BrkB family protein [Candidatus Tenderia electrophaga]
MHDTLTKYKDALQHQLWETDLSNSGWGRRGLTQTLRLLYVVLHELVAGQLTLRAMSLIYTTLISLVPLLAVSFSVLKAFGVQGQIEPFLLEFLAPLGTKGEEIGANIIGFIDNMNVGVLGAVGLGMLFYTVVSLVQKIEQTFNHIWHIKNPRSFLRRVTDYLSVLMIGPVMVVSALAMTASMVSSTFVQYIIAIEPFGTMFYYLMLTIPYILIIIAFTFMYMFIPNTSVKLGPALTGATVSGILWKTGGMLFASFAAGSTKYDAIYSSFAILITFMIWLYLSWLIFLLGSQIAFYRQHPEYVRPVRGDIELSSRQKEKLALLAMYWVGKHYYLGLKPWTLRALNSHLGVPSDLLSNTLDQLTSNGLILEIVDKDTTYIPAKDLDAITLQQLISITRHARRDILEHTQRQAEVENILADLDQAYISTLGDQTVRQWISEHNKIPDNPKQV